MDSFSLRRGLDPFWEHVESQLRWRRRLWVGVVLFLFCVLSAVPVVIDLWPKWTTRRMVRRLAQELNHLKVRAVVDQSPYLLKLQPEEFRFSIQKVNSCQERSPLDEETVLFVPGKKEQVQDYLWLTAELGALVGIPHVISEFCYDPWLGDQIDSEQFLAGFVIVPQKDWLQEGSIAQLRRTDRMTILLIAHATGKMIFD